MIKINKKTMNKLLRDCPGAAGPLFVLPGGLQEGGPPEKRAKIVGKCFHFRFKVVFSKFSEAKSCDVTQIWALKRVFDTPLISSRNRSEGGVGELGLS